MSNDDTEPKPDSDQDPNPIYISKKSKYKHLVISGGGPILLNILSAIQELEKEGILDISAIESIYGTSAGAIIAVILCLEYDWETVNDYFIKRPWHEVFHIKIQDMFDAYTKKGIFDLKTIEKCFKPLFDAKDIPLDITLSDFYKRNGKELHFFSFELNEYKVEDISYLTYPDLTLMTAIYMSCCLPLLFQPLFLNDKVFIDGGVACNYPLNYCIESGKNSGEILGFKNGFDLENSDTRINEDSTLLDFLLKFLFKAIFSVSTNYVQPVILNEIVFEVELNLKTLHQFLSSIDARKEYFQSGLETAAKFITNLRSREEDTTGL